jgi:hypothetical protein
MYVVYYSRFKNKGEYFMATFMYILGLAEKVTKTVCPTCAQRGEVMDSCPTCHGTAIQKYRVPQYYLRKFPIEIVKIDRDPKTGILRYWENLCEFYYETTDPTLNPYVPAVPYGVHLVHDNKESAEQECDRINRFLFEEALKRLKPVDVKKIVWHSTGAH